ncbi:NAD(P)H-hydrate dehydratase [Blastococcus sp. Marseille-P5729]|uniref:NAD(P)H-hydrate dehydratase n=1 Tax=Blastococcus sp. Marseille-P5729 TaxID=2086582 RepID=UPI000D0EFB11|nr:NAD(P)H-hydrate dehydratase [Blastococcus sp. Marseille-P5729]
MIGLYGRQQVQDAEAALMARAPAGSLMQKASYGLAQVVLRLLRESSGGAYGARVVLLVGPGGNGGDALHAGRFLRERGVAVTALLVADATYPGALAAYRRSGGEVQRIGDDGAADLIQDANLMVDGIAGLGSGREVGLPGDIGEAVATHGLVVAVDVPSGVAVDTGIPAKDAIRAHTTVTFGCYKPAHLLGAAYCGDVELVDIGLGPELPPAAAGVLTDDEVRRAWPRQPYDGHKYSTGVVGIAAGSAKYAGAAALCVGGALRAKPGMVRFVGGPPASDRVIEAWPECVVAPSVAEAVRTDAWVVGPGIGTDERGRELLDEVLAVDVPVLVDADGLTLLGDRVDELRQRAAPTVLTPHAGEFERIFFPIGDPLSAARRAAEDSGCVVLLKGPSTIVAAPGHPALVNATGSPRLATAGTGDVLAGVIGALLAAGLEPRMAAAMGAHAHGRAAQAASGPIIAGDLPDLLRAVVS